MKYKYGPGHFEKDPHRERLASRQWYLNYMGLDQVNDLSPAMLQWHAHGITRHLYRGGYHLTAAAIHAETALLPAEIALEDRQSYLTAAANLWDRASKRKLSNDLRDRRNAAAAFLPTLGFIAEARSNHRFGEYPHEAQDEAYRTYMRAAIEPWYEGNNGGIAFEVLSGYFLHRSNRLRPWEPALIAHGVSPRVDGHSDIQKRVDLDIYNLTTGLIYGAQVKSGFIGQPKPENSRIRRIMLVGASKLLCLPYTERRLMRTMEAVVEDLPQFRLDLDVISLELRETVKPWLRPERVIGQMRLSEQ